MKISELYGKTIKGANGSKKGYILGVDCNNCKIEGLICCDESEKTFYVAGRDVTALCGDTRFLNAEKARKNARSLKLGRAVYSHQGKFLGCLEDCVLSGMKITHAIVGGKKIPFDRLECGDAYIVKDAARSAELAAKNMFIGALCNNSESLSH